MPTLPRLAQLSVLVLACSAFTACVSLKGRPDAMKASASSGPTSAAVGVPVGSTVFSSGSIHLVKFAPQLVAAGNGNVARMEIPSGTPGVVLSSGEDWMAVSFARNQYLYFTRVEDRLDGSRIGDARSAGHYYLHLPDWNGRSGTVMLGGERWLAVDSSREVSVEMGAGAKASARSDSLSSRWLDRVPNR